MYPMHTAERQREHSEDFIAFMHKLGYKHFLDMTSFECPGEEGRALEGTAHTYDVCLCCCVCLVSVSV